MIAESAIVATCTISIIAFPPLLLYALGNLAEFRHDAAERQDGASVFLRRACRGYLGLSATFFVTRALISFCGGYLKLLTLAEIWVMMAGVAATVGFGVSAKNSWLCWLSWVLSISGVVLPLWSLPRAVGALHAEVSDHTTLSACLVAGVTMGTYASVRVRCRPARHEDGGLN